MSNMNSEINHINLAHLKDVDSNDISILPTIGLCQGRLLARASGAVEQGPKISRAHNFFVLIIVINLKIR